MQCGGCFASREQYLSFRLKKQIVKVLRSEFTERRAPLCPKMEYLSNTPGSNYPVANGGKGYKSRRLALVVLAIYTDSGSSRYLQKMDSLVSCDRKRGKHNMNLIRRIQHISPRSSFGSGTKHVSQWLAYGQKKESRTKCLLLNRTSFPSACVKCKRIWAAAPKTFGLLIPSTAEEGPIIPFGWKGAHQHDKHPSPQAKKFTFFSWARSSLEPKGYM